MKFLPFFIRFKMTNPHWWMPTLWLPVVLLWPFIFILGFLVFLLGLVAVVILDTRSIKQFFSLFGGIYLALCEFRGTRVDVEGSGSQIFISID